MKQLEVQIMGQSYILACPENGEVRMMQAVQRVDQAMCKIRDAGKIKAPHRIAVLAALNLAFDSAENAPDGLATVRAQDSPTDNLQDNNGASSPLSNLLARLEAALGTDGQLL